MVSAVPLRQAPPSVLPRALHAGAPVPAAPPRTSVDAGATHGGGGDAATRGGGGFKLGNINFGRMAVFAALGAAAAAVIPPLAALGGPVGGAVIGALLSLVL
ncbi:MAG: hypothetical protein JWM25_686 [Thermoleophilia bacterium]|nr:hypothetical protein [Thermoleophilia bacterium]MCZ4496103.1 hypothetical protein [Thermoleophilia bacterium]